MTRIWKTTGFWVSCLVAAALFAVFQHLQSVGKTKRAPGVELRFRLSKRGDVKITTYILKQFNPGSGQESASDTSVMLAPVYGAGELQKQAIGYLIASKTLGQAKVWLTKENTSGEWTLNAENNYAGKIWVEFDMETATDELDHTELLLARGHQQLEIEPDIIDDPDSAF